LETWTVFQFLCQLKKRCFNDLFNEDHIQNILSYKLSLSLTIVFFLNLFFLHTPELHLIVLRLVRKVGLLCSWSYGGWIYNYLCNQWLLPLMLCFRIPLRQGMILSDKICQWLATGRWFSPGTPVSSTNKTDHHDITEILLKVIKHHKPKHSSLIYSR
jgi:hypothetical protein